MMKKVTKKEYEGVAVEVEQYYMVVKMGFVYMKVDLTFKEWFNIYKGNNVRVTQWIEEKKFLGLFNYKDVVQHSEKIQ